MRIDELGKQQAVQDSTAVSRDKRQVKGDSFSSLLETAMNSDTVTGATAAVEAEAVNPLSAIAVTGQVSVDNNAAIAALSAVENGLKGLEDIGNSLMDQNVTPKEVDKMVQSLPSSVSDVQKSLENLPDGHPLKEIGNELSVTAYVESMKWRRGDYI